jgi:hypothetical protein
MAPGWYRAMAAGVLALHAAYIAWVMFGTFFTRSRPRLAVLHVATLFGLWCPLTALEEWLEVRGRDRGIRRFLRPVVRRKQRSARRVDLDRRPPSAMPGGIQRRILASEAWRASDLQDEQGFESSNNLFRALVCNPYEIQPESGTDVS